MRSPRVLLVALAAAAMLAVAAVVMLTNGRVVGAGAPGASELLLKLDLASHDPYSPPPNMYLWWGPSTNHRFVGSGEHIRRLLHLGQIEGGEWRSSMFLGNNGVATFRGQRFRRISETCCSTIVIPPMEWDFPVYNSHKVIGQRIRNFVANGNMLVLTGGILAIEFINSYFFYTIELADGNYSPGPYSRLTGVPECLKVAPAVLPQKGVAVTAVKKDSLPSGSEVLWGTPKSSPVFMIKFCEAQGAEGMPPVKVLPRDCPATEKEGRPCSCGYVMYIGYDFKEQYPTRWDKVLRGAVEMMSPVYQPPAGGYKDTATKIVPGVPPCLEGRAAAQNRWTRDQAQAGVVATLSAPPAKALHTHNHLRDKVAAGGGAAGGGQARHRGRGARGRGGKLAKAQRRMAEQQEEIDALEKRVRGLAARAHSQGHGAARRGANESLRQLRVRAARLLQVCVCVCVYVYIYIYRYTHISICVLYMCMYVCVCLCLCVCIR